MKRFLIGTTFAATVLFAGTAFANDEEKFRKMDSDGDGRVTAAEHSTYAQQMFTMMDANRDGAVTMEEMKAHKAMKKDGSDKGGMYRDSSHKEPAAKKDSPARSGGG